MKKIYLISLFLVLLVSSCNNLKQEKDTVGYLEDKQADEQVIDKQDNIEKELSDEQVIDKQDNIEKELSDEQEIKKQDNTEIQLSDDEVQMLEDLLNF